jgi:hypothetical protein
MNSTKMLANLVQKTNFSFKTVFLWVCIDILGVSKSFLRLPIRNYVKILWPVTPLLRVIKGF